MIKIGIAGVGGIGSNVAVNLIRCGITHLKIADFDHINPSNLNRQFYFYDQIGQSKTEMLENNLKRINPNIVIERLDQKLDQHKMENFFLDCHILVDGFDRSEFKQLFLETFGSSNKFLVMANGIAGTDMDTITIKYLKNGAIVGDFSSDVDNLPVFSTKVQLVAAKMSHLILFHMDQYQSVIRQNPKGWQPWT